MLNLLLWTHTYQAFGIRHNMLKGNDHQKCAFYFCQQSTTTKKVEYKNVLGLQVGFWLFALTE